MLSFSNEDVRSSVYPYRYKRVTIPAVIEGADNAGPRMKFGRSLKVNKRNSSSLSPLYRT
jgi:hypothetical protein